MHCFVLTAFLVLLVQLASCHLDHGSNDALNSARQVRAKRALGNCMKGRTVREAAERRESWANLIRKKRDIPVPSPVNHHSGSLFTSKSNPFTKNGMCVLQPEVTVGPYWVEGELIRHDVEENQAGVELFLDVQLIDVNTCRPVRNVYVDIWNCNATGVYGGVVADGNGDSSDLSNENATFLRGLQPTDRDGVANFKTIFPGHYTGRVNHIHVMVHRNGKVLPNNTYTSDTVPHIGQVFFDQDLINTVEATWPYNTNHITLNTNDDDFILQDLESGSTSDPFVNYVLLGNTVEDGLFAWITLGIDLSANHTEEANPNSFLTAEGGVKNPDAMQGPPGGPGGPCGMGGPGGPPGGFGPFMPGGPRPGASGMPAGMVPPSRGMPLAAGPRGPGVMGPWMNNCP